MVQTVTERRTRETNTYIFKGFVALRGETGNQGRERQTANNCRLGVEPVTSCRRTVVLMDGPPALTTVLPVLTSLFVYAIDIDIHIIIMKEEIIY